jgi:Cch helix turn helix domain
VPLPDGDHLVLRWSLARSFGELRRTKAHEIAERWQQAGFMIARRLSVTENGENITVLAFTPDAVRRLTPAVTDIVAAWPRLAPGDLRGLELPLPRGTTSSISAARSPKNSPDEALQAVMAWARTNKNTLQSAGSQELGQWEGTAQGESVLLVRQAYLNRILLGQKFDLRAIMTTWRDAGVIVADEKRFTVYTRLADRDQQGARFVAFRWGDLEAAGLERN